MKASPFNRRDEFHTLFREELLPGEKVLWATQPAPRVPLGTLLLAFPQVALLLTIAGALWFERTGVAPQAIRTVASGVFFLLAIAAGFTPCAWNRLKCRRTWYAITSERLMVVVKSLGTRRVGSAAIRDLPFVQKCARRDGTGTIRFGERPGSRYGFHVRQDLASPILTTSSSHSFVEIEDVPTVYALILELKRQVGNRQSLE